IPSSRAFSADITTSAAAASFTPGALPAVTVPSFRNAGASAASASRVASSRTDSSWLYIRFSAALFWRNGDGHDFGAKAAFAPGCRCFTMRFEREPVLLLARDRMLFGDVLACDSHVVIVVDIPQAVVDHGIHRGRITQPESLARLRQQIGRVAHRFHSTS